MIEYHKLVRDKIPEIIAQGGSKAVTHIADDKEFEDALKMLYIKNWGKK